MDITFNPPIGDLIQLETSFSLQTALLHFTAELTAHDHNKLIQDRARIQLWSDLPHNGQSLSDGGWGALDLTYQTQATDELSSSHQISLGSTCPIHTSEEKVTLFLEVVAPLPMSRNPHFSFTYRIVYPSGDIQWLGPFGQNGSLSFERSDHDLHNFGIHSWTFDKLRMAHVYEVKQPVDALVVARVRDVCNYCVRAMGPTRCLYLLNICALTHLIFISSFISDLKKAALLIFVPRSQPSSISLLPTYVFSASPGSSLTLSADGRITASGSGTLLFQANEGNLEPLTFIRQILFHAELDSWNVLPLDAGSKAIVLATPKDKFPIRAVTISLWYSKGLIRPIYIDTTTLSNMLGSTEFSIFSPDNMRIHLFTVDSQATPTKQMVALQSDSIGNDLVISPIYTLRDYQAATDISTTTWKTVILSPYRVQDFSLDDSGILPTPPPSPRLKPIACLSQSHPSSDTVTFESESSVPSLPLDTCISLQSPMNGNDESETLPSSNPAVNPDTDAHDTFPIQKPSELPSSQGIVAMFRSLFYSLILSVYLLLWGHRNSDSLDDTTKDRPQLQISIGREEDEDAHDDPGDDSGSLFIPETKTLLEGNIEIQTTQVRPSQSDAKIPEATAGYAVSDVSRAPDNTKGDVFYLQSEPSDSTSQKATTIALLCTTRNDPTDTTNAPSVINKNRVIDRCVQFLDGFEPECVVSRCNVDVFSHGGAPEEQEGGSSSSYSCCLLQYQLDCGSDLEKSERTIRIVVPPGVDLLD